MSEENYVTIRWADKGVELIQIFRYGDEDTEEIIRPNDPRFADLKKVLWWIPPDNEFVSDSGTLFIRWWDAVPLETISHLVKKT